MPFSVASAFCRSGRAPLWDAIAIVARKAARMMVRFSSLDGGVTTAAEQGLCLEAGKALLARRVARLAQHVPGSPDIAELVRHQRKVDRRAQHRRCIADRARLFARLHPLNAGPRS